MSLIQSVIEYPEEGFAILQDNNGRFLAFRDHDNIEDLDDEPLPFHPPKISDYLKNLLVPDNSDVDLDFEPA